MEQLIVTNIRPRRSVAKPMVIAGVFIALVVILFYVGMRHMSTPPSDFPVGESITIPEGSSIKSVAQILVEKGVIRTSLLFHVALDRIPQDRYVQAGTYTFPNTLSVSQVVEAVTKGMFRSPQVSITLPEGFRARELRELLPDLFALYTDEELDALDGTLFPDTYFFSTTDTAEDVIATLQETQDERLRAYGEEIATSGFSESEIITLASILEREANDAESKQIVSGILQNRLRDNMPLQVDATFHYLLGKTSAEITQSDLQMNSPYNTYRNRGLPPHAIANPGIRAIEAALRPQASEYVYYLTGNNGVFYYAQTFEEHKRNKERYLQ